MGRITANTNANISIIVPVYNVGKYLVRCLDSIFNQYFSGTYEVIAVEDKSTDNSLQILKSYQKRQTQLKIIEHDSNKKLSVARATGMKAATGDYIMHVDSDDWLFPNALENLYNKCVESEADVIVFNHVKENIKGERSFVNSIKEETTTKDKLKVLQYFFGAPWNKIVKRSLTENMIYGQVGVNNTEDLLYASEILFRAQKICLIPQSYYVYSVNNNSLTNKISPNQYLQNRLIVYEQLQRIILNYNSEFKIKKNFVRYFEKSIYLSIAKIYFINKKKINESKNFIQKFNEINTINISNIRKIELAMKYKYFSLTQVTRLYGMKTSIWIIFNNIKNSNKD